jgi:hypothetical protein
VTQSEALGGTYQLAFNGEPLEVHVHNKGWTTEIPYNFSG